MLTIVRKWKDQCVSSKGSKWESGRRRKQRGGKSLEDQVLQGPGSQSKDSDFSSS